MLPDCQAEVIALFCRLNMNAKRDLPIRSSEMGLLILTVTSQTPISPNHAADYFKVSKPMVTKMVNQLVKDGYLTKVPVEDDKRSCHLVPTEKASQLVEQTYTAYHRHIHQLVKGMGRANFEKMVKLLDQANHILAEEKDHG